MDWLALRAHLPVTEHWAYFDHAAVAPLSAPARDMLVDYAHDTADHGIAHSAQWLERISATRKLFAHLLNTSPQNLAFVKNTTEGINFVAEGFPWKAGDNLVTAADEYPSNVYPWRNLADRRVDTRIVPSRKGVIAFDDIRDHIDSRTRLVTLSYVEFATGFRNDVLAVGELCRELGLFFFVDAIQGLGVLPLDLGTLPIDALSADGHKWLLGPEGAGIFYLNPAWLDRIRPVSVGWHSVERPSQFNDLNQRLKANTGRFENGTANVGGIAALGASLQLLLECGVEPITERLRNLTDHLCERLRDDLGWNVYSPRGPEQWSSIVSVITPVDPEVLVRDCKKQGIIVNVRAGRLRISPHAYNTFQEIDRLVAVLGEAARGAT
jgi:selenocysteine lyase/cysteine desulfurase